MPGGEPVYEVRIPRIKKRTRGERDQYRTRQVQPMIGALLEQLAMDNRINALWKGRIDRQRYNWPLLRRAKIRPELAGTSMEAEAYRVKSSWPGQVLREVAEALDLRTRDGKRLNLTPRRLRYTFATRLVEEGASPQELADALDHSSTEYVMVYFNSRLDAVKRIDAAVGPALAPVAQAFLGKLAQNETDAVGDGPRLRRISHVSPTMNAMRNVGSCGELGMCTLAAPIACYTCRDFVAWVEADHRSVLDALLRERARKLEGGADPKWTQIHDRTIESTKEIIRRCDLLNDAARAA